MNQASLVLTFAAVLAIPATAYAGPMNGIGAAVSRMRFFPSVNMLSVEVEGGVSFGRTSVDSGVGLESGPSGPDFLGGATLVYSTYLLDAGLGFAAQQLPNGVDSRVLYGRFAFRVHVPVELDRVVMVPGLGLDGGVGRAPANGLVGNFGFTARVGFAVGRMMPFTSLGYRRHFLDATTDAEVNHRQFEVTIGISIRLAGDPLARSHAERRARRAQQDATRAAPPPETRPSNRRRATSWVQERLGN